MMMMIIFPVVHRMYMDYLATPSAQNIYSLNIPTLYLGVGLLRPPNALLAEVLEH